MVIAAAQFIYEKPVSAIGEIPRCARDDSVIRGRLLSGGDNQRAGVAAGAVLRRTVHGEHEGAGGSEGNYGRGFVAATAARHGNDDQREGEDAGRQMFAHEFLLLR